VCDTQIYKWFEYESDRPTRKTMWLTHFVRVVDIIDVNTSIIQTCVSSFFCILLHISFKLSVGYAITVTKVKK
jgi:hypothetical protein